MRFFSGRGDEGKTSLMDGKPRLKSEEIFNLIGTLDEITAQIGMALSFSKDQVFKQDLSHIQKTLSLLMGLLSNGSQKIEIQSPDLLEAINWLEGRIEQYGSANRDVSGFVFPGETRLGACLDVCRTVTRRAERVAVRFVQNGGKPGLNTLAFLNRLSSLFFIMRLAADSPDFRTDSVTP